VKYHVTEYTLGSVLTLADGRRYAFIEPKTRVINLAEALPWRTDSLTKTVITAKALCTAQTPNNTAAAHPAAGPNDRPIAGNP
jgi:hypothetical protein